MVCQHILLFHLRVIEHNEKPAHAATRKAMPQPELNGQIAFLEEFARDEQLLRGREGYALVTLQASLHFLNVCSVDEMKHEILDVIDSFEDFKNNQNLQCVSKMDVDAAVPEDAKETELDGDLQSSVREE
jgi:Vacuolar sorting protein 9 (VPS9) domain